MISEASSLCVLILDFFCCVCDLARTGYRDTITHDIRRWDKIMTDGNGKEVQQHNFFFLRAGRSTATEADTGSEPLFLLYVYIL